MTDYEKLVKALRCKRDDCEGCDLAFFDKDEGWMCQYAAKDDDAADAIEALERELSLAEIAADDNGRQVEELQAQMPKRGEIVRCGECRHHDTGIDEEGKPFLKCLNGRSYGGTTVDWFCADGEREVQE